MYCLVLQAFALSLLNGTLEPKMSGSAVSEPYSLALFFSLSLFLLSVYHPGGSLEYIIGQDGCLQEDVVRKFGWDLVKGLKYIHELGIILSDLNPAKVWIHSFLCIILKNTMKCMFCLVKE